MKKSGLADSPFFAPAQPKVEPVAPPSAIPPVQKVEPEKKENRFNGIFRGWSFGIH